MENTPQSQREKQPVNNVRVMAALILLPIILSALLWWIMPSGYQSWKLADKDKGEYVLNGWHPMQPALRQAFQIINP
jgi:hypothetical protein